MQFFVVNVKMYFMFVRCWLIGQSWTKLGTFLEAHNWLYMSSVRAHPKMVVCTNVLALQRRENA